MRHLGLVSALVLMSVPFSPAHAFLAGKRMRQNTHLVDRGPNGFALYRVSEPNGEDMREFCRLGITELMVLSGDGAIDEGLAKVNCPGLTVVYDFRQSAKIPLSAEFLRGFDKWVYGARLMGKRIAFRCHCGCHRTGRLAAYYQMKYQGASVKAAMRTLRKYAKLMILYPMLDNQVRALKDYIEGRPCSEREKYCVRTYEE